MAEIVKTVRIETGNGERSVKSLKKEISDLRDALLNVEKGSEDWINISRELTEAQEDLNNVLKAGKQTIDADSTSIAGMEARYKSLYQTFRLLSAEQRKSAEGISMQKELSQLSENLNKTKKDAGNFKDNIGHYADDMMDAFGKLGISVGGLQGPFKMASMGASGFKKVLDTLKAHPFIAIAAVLIGLFKKINDAIKGNEELQMRMNKVMAAFKPIGDAVSIVLDKIAGVAVRVAEGIAKVVTWVMNLTKASKELSGAELELADMENKLIKNRREFETLNSEDEARVASLREQAATTEDMVEKEKLLNEAKQIQEQINQRNLDLAKQELAVIEKKNAITPSSTADLDAEAKARQKVNQVTADGANKIRNLDKAIQGAHSSATKGADEEKKKLDELLKKIDENSKTEKQKLKEKYEEEKKLLVEYHKDTTELTKQYQKDLAKLESEAFVAAQSAGLRTLYAQADKYVKPSHAAFQAASEAVTKEFGKYLKYLEDYLGGKAQKGKDEYLLDASKIFNGEELTQEAQNLAAIFGVDLEAAEGLEKTIAKINDQIQVYYRKVAETDRAQIDWENSIAETRKELKMMYDTNEWYNLAQQYLNSSTTMYAQALGNMNEAEHKYLVEKVRAAESNFEFLRNMSEEELNYIGYTLEDQLEAERAFYDAREELRQKDLENAIAKAEREKELNQELVDSAFELGDAHLNSINSIADTYKVLLNAYKEDGKISEKEAKKKAKTLQWLEGIQGAVAVAQIVADTASGWMSINKSLAAEYVLNAETAAATGPAAAATKAALDAKSLIAANIRKAAILVNGITAAAAAVGKTVASIKGLGGGDSGDAAGAGSAPMLIDSTPYSYTRELQTNVEREEQLNTPIYVRVTDIETAQARVRVTENETTF